MPTLLIRVGISKNFLTFFTRTQWSRHVNTLKVIQTALKKKEEKKRAISPKAFFINCSGTDLVNFFPL